MSKIPKIGIFGWTGTGKTTYISMLHYLLSSNKHPFIISSYVEDDDEIEKNIEYFLLNKKWDDITNKIQGSLHTSTLLFTVNTKDGCKKFEIQDYKGESISKQKDKSEDEIHKYFLGCDSLLLFLDAEAFEESNGVENRKRWNEFQTILHKLIKENEFKITSIPIYLIITKKDILDFDENNNIIMSSSRIKERYEGMMEVIDNYSKSTKPFFISSKLCFEYYIKNKENDTDNAEEFCAPVLRSLREIQINEEVRNTEKKRKEEKIEIKKINDIKKQKEIKKIKLTKSILKKITVIFLIIISIYGFLYMKYNNEIEEISHDSNIDNLRRFKAEHSLLFFPSLKDKLNNQISYDTKKLMEKMQDMSISDHDRLDLINEFTKLFPTVKYRNNLDKKLLNVIQNIEISSIIVNRIIKSKRKDFSKSIILCDEYYNLETNYFNNSISSFCKIAKSDKEIAQKKEDFKRLQEKIARQKSKEQALKIRMEEESERRERAENKSWWDKFWE